MLALTTDFAPATQSLASGANQATERRGVTRRGPRAVTVSEAEMMSASSSKPRLRESPERRYRPRRRRSRHPRRTASQAPFKRTVAAQTVGTNFLGATLFTSGYLPPDSMGAIGPSQFLLAVNGRIKTFAKNGTADGI